MRRQLPRRSRALLLLSVLAHGCGPLSDPLDSTNSGLQLCGFPEGQLDLSQVGPPSYLTSIGRVRLGQSLPMELRGDMTRVDGISWRVEPRYGQTETHSAFTAVVGSSASLVGLKLSAGDYDYDFAFAHVIFRDGSEVNAVVSVCSGNSWRPADHMVVVP